jgi:hypothetical protein
MKTHQKMSEQFWQDENGMNIPTNRLTDLEKQSERHANKLLKEAKALNAKLVAYKEVVTELCEKVYEASLSATKTEGKGRKGNFTWYNFNRTIKVEVSISERIEFDDLTIQACKEKLDQFISNGTTGVDDFMKTLIMSAFEKSSGSLDAKKVLSLKKHKNRTKDLLYHEAMELLDQAVRRPESKRYFRIFEMDEDGKYHNVDLNFSSI